MPIVCAQRPSASGSLAARSPRRAGRGAGGEDPSRRAPPAHAPALLVASLIAIAALVLATLTMLAAPPAHAFAVPLLDPTPTAAADAHSTAIPCLVVSVSGCPPAPGAAISVHAPGTVVVVGANWAPGAAVTVLLVPVAQPCTARPAASAQARASTAGVFSVVLALPANAPNGALYGVCAASDDGKQTFPAAGLAVASPLRIHIVRATPPAVPAPAPPIDGFSLAALVLAALSAGVFVLTWLRGRRAKASTER